MEDLLLALLEAVLEIAGEALLQLLFEFITELFTELFNRQKESRPAVRMLGLIVLGALAGLVSVWLFPHRLIATRVALPGASLLLAPLLTGCIMQFFGNQLRSIGRSPSRLATFRGGALFALSMALIRWWLVGLQ